VGHIFSTPGSYTVEVTATDKDGGVSDPITQVSTIATVQMQSTVLAVGGTLDDDVITLRPADAQGNIAVTVNGVSQGVFRPTSRILVYAQDGNDLVQELTITVKHRTVSVAVPAALFGGGGDDNLDARGSTGNNILAGGAGDDLLQGGSGPDMLVGGLDADLLHGNNGDDLLIGGITDYDGDLAALTALMAEWISRDNYATRINLIQNGGGVNGLYQLNSMTVHDDAAVDVLFGESGRDWFLYAAGGLFPDLLQDKKSNEIATAM
jgi:Ca2+-binding RTX toxin-like protein